MCPFSQVHPLQISFSGSKWTFTMSSTTHGFGFPAKNVKWILKSENESILIVDNHDRVCVFRDWIKLADNRLDLCFPAFTKLLAGCC